MRILSMILMVMLSCSSVYAACYRDASGKVICNGQSYSESAGQSWKNSHQEQNNFGVTTTQTNRGGELKTKNGKAIYQSPKGKNCYKTAASMAAFEAAAGRENPAPSPFKLG